MCTGTDESAGYHKIDGRKWRNRIGEFAAVLQSFLGTEDSAVASHRGSHMKDHVWVEEDNIGNVNGFVVCVAHVRTYVCKQCVGVHADGSLQCICGIRVHLIIYACSCLCLSRMYLLRFSNTCDKVETGSDFNHIFLLPLYNPKVNLAWKHRAGTWLGLHISTVIAGVQRAPLQRWGSVHVYVTCMMWPPPLG